MLSYKDIINYDNIKIADNYYFENFEQIAEYIDTLSPYNVESISNAIIRKYLISRSNKCQTQ